jgi:hypothetical protein
MADPVAPVVVTTVSNELPPATLARTPDHLPDVIVRTITPLVAILVRSARVFFQTLVGLLLAGVTGTTLLPAHDFWQLLRTCAGLSVASAVVCALQNTIELLKRIDQKFPTWAPVWLLAVLLGAGMLTVACVPLCRIVGCK